MFGHGQYSGETHRKINTACDWAAAAEGAEPSPACKAQLAQMSREIGGYNVYNIYDQCKLAGDNTKLKTFLEWEELLGGSEDNFEFDPLPSHAALGAEGGSVATTRSSSSGGKRQRQQRQRQRQQQPDPDFGYLCGAERGELAYLNQPDVRQALHVCSAADCGAFGPGTTWTAPYNRTVYNEGELYKEFVDRGLRVMIYSGDTDGCIPYSGTEEWVEALKLPTVESWRPWTLDNATQMAGYVTTYNRPAGKPGSFLFATIRGAGHMVPRYRPAEILLAINSFFAGPVPLPGYSRDGGGGGGSSPMSARCRVTTDAAAVQTTSHGGHD
eukprot:SAG22_NODE_3475_length_1689_cov_1.808805_1_plen_326_part_10